MLNSDQICYTGYFIALRSRVNDHSPSQFGIAMLSSQDEMPSAIASFEQHGSTMLAILSCSF